MSTTPNLGLPYIDAGQAQKHVTHNEALRYLDALVQLAVQDRDLTAPPDTPAEGQRWIVKTGATDAWSGHADDIAAWQDGAWQFSAPAAGWVAYVIDEEILAAWDGDSWNAVSAGSGGGDPTELQDMTLLGIGTTADTANPLSAKLNNVLWTAKTVAEGGDGTLRYKLSKESAAKTLSFLLQDNFAGCAEIGLTGDDDFHFKVSPDGTSWVEAIKIDRATGKISFPVSGGPREVLSANLAYYVRADGSDSNNGLANTSGGAFLTVQKAVDTVCNTLDLAGFNVTINLGAGTRTSAVTLRRFAGGGTVTIAGDTVTPSNVLFSCTNVLGCFAGDNVRGWTIKGVKVATATAGYGFVLTSGSLVALENCEYGAIASGYVHIFAGDPATYIQLSGANQKISGGAVRFIQLNAGSRANLAGTITLSGTPAFSNFVYLDQLCSLQSSATFSGSATGQRYLLGILSAIQTFGAGASYFPGDAAGSAGSAGGQYA